MNANKIRKKFIEDNAEHLLNELSSVLKGEGAFSSESTIHLDYALGLLEHIVKKADDIKKVEAMSTKEIMSALSGGKITVSEAKELMGLLKLEAEIQNLKDGPISTDTVPSVIFNFREGKNGKPESKGSSRGERGSKVASSKVQARDHSEEES